MGEQYDIVINIQGDEPLMEPHIIDDVVLALKHSPDAVYRRAAAGRGAPACAGPAAAGPSSQRRVSPSRRTSACVYISEQVCHHGQPRNSCAGYTNSACAALE